MTTTEKAVTTSQIMNIGQALFFMCLRVLLFFSFSELNLIIIINLIISRKTRNCYDYNLISII